MQNRHEVSKFYTAEVDDDKIESIETLLRLEVNWNKVSTFLWKLRISTRARARHVRTYVDAGAAPALVRDFLILTDMCFPR